MFSSLFTCNFMSSGCRYKYSSRRRWSRRYWKFGDSGMCDNGWCTSGWKWFRGRCKVIIIIVSYLSWKEKCICARWNKQKNSINWLNIYRAVLGGADDRNCTYNNAQSNGYLKRQVNVTIRFKIWYYILWLWF